MLPNPIILNFPPYFGVQANQFGFRVSWATNLSVVLGACTNLATPVWSPLATNTLTGAWSYSSDPQWTNYPSRIYRVRSLSILQADDSRFFVTSTAVCCSKEA